MAWRYLTGQAEWRSVGTDAYATTTGRTSVRATPTGRPSPGPGRAARAGRRGRGRLRTAPRARTRAVRAHGPGLRGGRRLAAWVPARAAGCRRYAQHRPEPGERCRVARPDRAPGVARRAANGRGEPDDDGSAVGGRADVHRVGAPSRPPRHRSGAAAAPEAAVGAAAGPGERGAGGVEEGRRRTGSGRAA